MLRASYQTAGRAVTGLRRTYRALRTVAIRATGGSDVSRWADLGNYDPEWGERTVLLGEWIPANSRVLEFGSGRQVLRAHLPAGCTYQPADLVKHNAETLVYDLNHRPFQPLPPSDVVVLSGVLEYLTDLDEVAAFLSTSCRRVVTSYAAIDIGGNGRLVDRRAAGWFNDYTSERVQEIFRANGFAVTAAKPWSNQILLCLDA